MQTVVKVKLNDMLSLTEQSASKTSIASQQGSASKCKQDIASALIMMSTQMGLLTQGLCSGLRYYAHKAPQRQKLLTTRTR